MNNVQKTRWLSFMGLWESSLIIRPGNMFVYPIIQQVKERRINQYKRIKLKDEQ